MEPELAAKAAAGDPAAQACALPLIAARQQEELARQALAAAQVAAAQAAAAQAHGAPSGGDSGRGGRAGRAGRVGRGSRASGGPAAWEVADTAGSGPASKRPRLLLPLRPYPQPWEAQEVRASAALHRDSSRPASASMHHGL